MGKSSGDSLQRSSLKTQTIAPVQRTGWLADRGCSYPFHADAPRNADGSPNRTKRVAPPSRRRTADPYWGRTWTGSASDAWKEGKPYRKPAQQSGIRIDDFPLLEVHDDALRRVFDRFKQWGENTAHDGLFSRQLMRFARDCSLIDASRLTTAKLDLLFQRCVHVAPEDGRAFISKTEMSLEQFKEAIVEIASARDPDEPDLHVALEAFLEDTFVPYAAELMVTEFDGGDQPEEVEAMLTEMAQPLRFVFDHYSKGVEAEAAEPLPVYKAGMTAAEIREADAERARETAERYAERAKGLDNIDIREMMFFTEQFGITGSATHSNKASLLSNREVMRVARSVKSSKQYDEDHGLTYSDWLIWLERISIEAFKEAIHGLPTSADRLEHLLVYIDSCPVLAELSLGAGFTHRCNFTKNHRITPQQQQKMQAAAGVTAATDALVGRVADFTTGELEREREMALIFEYYASFAEKAPMDQMKAQGLAKLCHDCELFNDSFRPEQVDLVHLQASGSQIHTRITIRQWLVSLVDIARRRDAMVFGSTLAISGELADNLFRAACELIDHQIRAKAMKAAEIASDCKLAREPAVQQVLNDMLPLLKRMFAYYCSTSLAPVVTFRRNLHPRDATLNKEASLAAVSTAPVDADMLSFAEFIKLANDFHLCQRVGSTFDLGMYFRASCRSRADKSHLNFDEFLELIVRCALDYCDLDEVESEPVDAAEGVFAFIATFFRSMGMTRLHSAQGGTDPIKKEDDPAGFLQWMDATMRSTGIVAGGRPPLRDINKPTQLAPRVPLRPLLPSWAYKLLNLPAFKEYVYEVFDGYRDEGPGPDNADGGFNEMPSKCFRDFCRDARVYGATINTSQVDSVILKCTGGSEFMSNDDFLCALHQTSAIKFCTESKPSRGLVRLLREHLLPLLRAGETDLSETSGMAAAAALDNSKSSTGSSARSVLNDLQAGVGLLFEAYSEDGQTLDLAGLCEFCAAHSILPELLCAGEVRKLAATLTKTAEEDANEVALTELQFVDWIGVCAQHAIRDNQLGPSDKVAKLVEVIRENASPYIVGDWATPQYKEAFGISLSTSGPRKVTCFSPQKASRELSALAQEAVRSRPPSATELAQRGGHDDVLRRIFQCYCGHGAGRPVNTLGGGVINKMFKDCSVYGKTMKYEHMDIIFLEASGGRKNNPHLQLDYAQFLSALLKTACRKYPGSAPTAAFEKLLSECILPFANREAAEVTSSLRLQPSVAQVLADNQQLIELIFCYYTDLDIDPQSSADHLKDAISLSFRELTLWAKDFGLIGTAYGEGISQVRMAKVFQAVCQIMVDEKIFTSHKHLPFEGFEEVLCRVAVQLISTAYYSATVEERVAALIGKLRAHKAMLQIETWLGRTQTNRVHMYRSKTNGTQQLMNSQTDSNKWTPPSVKNVTPVTRRMTQRAESRAGKNTSPIKFNASKASNPAQQSCLRGYFA